MGILEICAGGRGAGFLKDILPYLILLLVIVIRPFGLFSEIIIGDLGSIQGPLFGAVVVVILKEAFIYGDKLLEAPLKLYGITFKVSSLYEFAIGLLIALFVIYKPKGMAGAWQDIISVLRSWPLTKGIRYGLK